MLAPFLSLEEHACACFITQHASRNGGSFVLAEMNASPQAVCARIKQLGYSISTRIRIYGEDLEVLSDPFPHEDGVAIYVKDRQQTRRILRLPEPLIQTACERRNAPLKVA
jgi:hypothetical protein